MEGEEDKGWGQVQWGIHFTEHISRQKSLSKLGFLNFVTKVYKHGDAWVDERRELTAQSSFLSSAMEKN